ncbi:hypothetical protein KGQ71_01020 [Patescibacteria group bacterium]|nr:hypothetical protein [Patescibacteria group bacterium]
MEERKKFREGMASGETSKLSDCYSNVAAPEEVERVVTEACALVPENERERIREWWRMAREYGRKQWEQSHKQSVSALGRHSLLLQGLPLPIKYPKDYLDVLKTPGNKGIGQYWEIREKRTVDQKHEAPEQPLDGGSVV